MSVSFCCFSFDRSSLPALREIKKEAEIWKNISAAILIVGLAYSFVYGAIGVGLSLFTGGQLTTLGTLLFSSPVFFIGLGVAGVVGGVAWTVQKVASHLLGRIDEELPPEEGQN